MCRCRLSDRPHELAVDGGALRLTGSECLEYATDPGLRPDALTLSAWFRIDDARTVSLVGKAFDANTTEDNSYELWISDASTIHFSTVNGADPHVFEDGIAPLTWYHVAGTFDGAIKRLYLDGIERMTKVAGATSYDDEPFRIGCDRGNGGVGNFVIGDLDDVRLYRRALTPTEISEIASQPP